MSGRQETFRVSELELGGEVLPLVVTLSREMKRDSPDLFQPLLDLALRQGQNICADTDKKAEVWNGVVTKIAAEKLNQNAETRVEQWKVDVKARFGTATLDYLVKRDETGNPVAFCPASSEEGWGRAPDFLWQDLPDVASKGVEQGEWVVNNTMWERELVTVKHQPSMPGEVYVYDDHFKNVLELLFCGLGGYAWTIVHENKRYGFKDEAMWKEAVEELKKLRQAVTFE